MLTIAGNVVKYLRYWKTALKNRAFRCCFQREGDGESPSASLSAASLERPRESAAGASRYRSAEMCASTIRVVPRLTSPLSQGRGFIFVGADAHIGPAERNVFTVIPGEFATFFGPTESSAPTSRFPPRRVVGADDSVRPQDIPMLRDSSANSYAPRLPLGTRGAVSEAD